MDQSIGQCSGGGCYAVLATILLRQHKPGGATVQTLFVCMDAAECVDSVDATERQREKTDMIVSWNRTRHDPVPCSARKFSPIYVCRHQNDRNFDRRVLVAVMSITVAVMDLKSVQVGTKIAWQASPNGAMIQSTCTDLSTYCMYCTKHW